MLSYPTKIQSHFNTYWITFVQNTCKTNLTKLCELIGYSYNKNKTDLSNYQVSDLVILNNKNLMICCAAKTFDTRYLAYSNPT
jgi:hypothetical protein